MFSSPSVHSLYLRRWTYGFALFWVLVRAQCRGTTSQASVLTVCSSCGNKRGTSESKSSSVNSLYELRHRVIWWDQFLVEIFYSVEGGDEEQGCLNLEINLPCLRLLSISHLCLYLACLHCSYPYMFDLSCAILFYAWGLFAHTCIQSR